MGALPELTKRQRQVFDFVRARVEAGSSPTSDEICRHFRFKSSNAARQHLRLIAQKGYLQLKPRSARGIRVNQESTSRDEIVRVPLLGRIAAGQPINAIGEVEAELPLPRGLWRGDRLFALRVRGDSMVEVGIFDGDIAVVNEQVEVVNGQVAAVIIDENVTLKQFFRSVDGVCLRAANKDYQDLVFDHIQARAVRIAGLLVGTLRSF